MMLKWTLNKQDVRCSPESSGSEEDPVAGSCEHSNAPLISVKCRNYLD